jgi:cytochrome c oxidase subunit 2
MTGKDEADMSQRVGGRPNEETGAGTAMSVAAFLDDATEPFAVVSPPGEIALDTRRLPDGEHVLRLRAVDALGNVGWRRIPFTVNNGPGITVTGLRPGSSVHGAITVSINAFSGEEPFSPRRAESQAPVPVWTWVLFALIAAWAVWYGIEFFPTPPEFAATPTYAANPSAVAGMQPASGPNAESPPKYSGGGSVAGFDYAALGATAFTERCASCHGANGTGVPGVFPPLAGDPVVMASDPRAHIRTVLHGLHGVAIRGTTYAAAMPSFASLSDQEIAAIIDHERTSWGNNAPLITPGAVARQR